MKNIKSAIFIISFSLLIIGCGGNDPDTSANNELTESQEEQLQDELMVAEEEAIEIDSVKLNKALDQIWNTSKIQEKNKQIINYSNGESNLLMMPYNQGEHIAINVGEDNGTTFATYYNFRITPANNWAIEFYDIPTDEYLNLQEWDKLVEKGY